MALSPRREAAEQLAQISQLMQPHSPSRQTAAREPASPTRAPNGAATSAASAPALQAELASHIAADAELQQSLRSFSSSFGADAAPTQRQSVPFQRFDPHVYTSDRTSSLASAAPSPAVAPAAAPAQQPPSHSLFQPAPPSAFPSFLTNFSSYTAQAQSSKLQLDADLARHEAALAAARQRLENMGITGLPGRFKLPTTADEYASTAPSRADSEVSSTVSSLPVAHDTRSSTHAPAHQPISHISAQQWRAEIAGEAFTTSGDDDNTQERKSNAQARAANAARSRARSAVRPKAGSSTARPASATRAKPASSGPATARSGTFGSAVRPFAAALSHKKPSTPAAVHASPTRAQAPVHASPAKASPHVADVDSSAPLPATPDDITMQWAERYKHLLNRNTALTKKNKELTLRQQALQSTVQQLTAEVAQVTTERDEALQQQTATEEKLSSCKAALRSEREAASFHASKHLAAAEAQQISAMNRLRAEHDTAVDALERSLAEARKRAKTLTLVNQGVQGKLDAQTAELVKLERDSKAHIEQLQSSLANSVAHAHAISTRLARCEAVLKDRDATLRSADDKLADTLSHAERLSSELHAAQTDRADLLRSFRALQAWTDSLVSAEGQLAGGLTELQRDADKIRQAGEEYTQQMRALAEQQAERAEQRLAAERVPSVPASPARAPPTERAHSSPRSSAPSALASHPASALSFASPARPATSHLAPPSASPASQHALLPQSTLLRQALLMDHDESLLASPRPVLRPQAASALYAHARKDEEAMRKSAANTAQLLPLSHAAATEVSVPVSAAAHAASYTPLVPGDTLAQLQARLQQLNVQSARL